VNVYCALVHHPVRSREGAMITSAITNVDVHDIARSARTYGLRGYFVVSPIAAQRLLVDRILDHWRAGAGARRVPDRSEALSRCHPIESVEAAIATITSECGALPEIAVTEARPEHAVRAKTFAAMRSHIAASSRPMLILFGTAHGLHPDLLARADHVIEPIEGTADYNHLSVRAAAAITFDRLFARSGGA
jgi:hypothetical protein